MNALSLFSGIGGIDLAAEWAGIKTVAMCEREPFCQKVLKKHWPDVPVYDDVCTLTKERLEADGIGTIELIHGGYPCQPFSHAGKREGTNDDRHRWPEVFRLIQAFKPRWFIGENVAGHVSLGLDIVLSELESVGYSWETFIIPACAVNSPNRRDRVFIVGYSECIGRHWESWGGQGRSLRTDISNWKKGLWPTPRANDSEKRGEINVTDPRNGLPGAVRMWGTPTASMYKGSSQHGSDRWQEEILRGNIKGQVMEPNNKGQLNPDWVETLMGFPIGWTDIDGQLQWDKNSMSGSLQESQSVLKTALDD